MAKPKIQVPVPSGVKILGKTYQIEGVEPDDRELVEGYAAGHINFRKLKILYREDQHPDQIRDTLLHEVIHGCEDVHDVPASEEYVRSLATMLLDVLRSNPEFTKYLLDDDSSSTGGR